jgi:four helix bundle protein
LQDLKERMRDFALRIIRLYDASPRRGAARVIGEQLLRSGTSVGAHYREAIRSRSSAEYAAKMNGGLMELEETLYWVELFEHSGVIPPQKLAGLKDEIDQLTAILVSLVKRAKR